MKKIVLSGLLLIATLGTAQTAPFKIAHWQTSKGTEVLFYQAMEVPMLDISLAFAAGSAYDGSHYGLSSLTTGLLNEGNAGQSNAQIAERLAEVGAQFMSQSSRDMAVFNLRTLTEDKALKQAFDCYKTILGQPDFPEEAFQRGKSQQLLAIQQAQESPDQVAEDIFYDKLYSGHPYAHPVIGTMDAVKTISRGDVVKFYQRYFVSKNATLVLTGAIDSETAHRLAEELSASLNSGESAPALPKAKDLSSREVFKVNYPSSQSAIRIGQVGISHHDKEIFPLLVGNYILGGGSMVSRLALEVREKRGLTYGVYSQFIPMPGEGPFVISLSTKNQAASLATQLSLKILQKFIEKGPNQQELQAAKSFMTGSFPLALSSNSSIGNMLLKIGFYHLPDDYLSTYVNRVEAVTLKQIKAAFQSHIQPKHLLFVTVGQQ